jgi:Proprotein convertase P-domain
MEVCMNYLHSSVVGFTVKTLLAGFLMLGLVACPENPDLIPDSFTVPPVTGAALGVDTSSETFTVSGISAAVPISIVDGKYQIDSAPFTTAAGTISAGQTVKVSLLSSGSFSTTKTASITVGGVTGTFSVTTLAADTTPDAFSFPAVTGAAFSTLSVSTPITVTGINTDAPISISSGGEYSIDSTTNFVSTPGTVKNAQVVRVRATSSATFNTPVNVVLTIGGVTGTFTITTRPADTTPDTFSFTPVTGVERNTLTTSLGVKISGLNSSAPITVSGGEYAIDAQTFTNQPGTITDGQIVQVRGTSSSSLSTVSEVKLTIGGVSGVFSITTRAEDQTPDVFSFTDVTGVPSFNLVNSNTLTITGFETAPISITGGFFTINGSAVSTGIIKNGDTVRLGAYAPSSPATSQKVTLTIGTFSTTWTVTTSGLVTIPATEAFPISIANGSGDSTILTGDAQYGAASIVHFVVPNYPGVVLNKVSLSVKITHPYRNDLQILLYPPNGSFTTPQGAFSTIYFAIPGQSGSDNIDATFDDDATNEFISSCSSNFAANTCTGMIRPFNPFGLLDVLNQSPTGQWRVEVRDGYKQAAGGTIVSTFLNLTYKPAP